MVRHISAIAENNDYLKEEIEKIIQDFYAEHKEFAKRIDEYMVLGYQKWRER